MNKDEDDGSVSDLGPSPNIVYGLVDPDNPKKSKAQVALEKLKRLMDTLNGKS